MADTINNATDAELITIAEQFHSIIAVDPAAYNLAAIQVTQLHDTITAYKTALTEHVAAQAAARTATGVKDGDRTSLEQLLRTLLRIAKAAPGTTAAQIAALGIADNSSAPAQTATRPTATVDTSERLRHTIDFRDEAAPNIKRRPAGAVGCEIFIKIGGSSPVDESECDFLTLDTATPYLAVFDGADAGKTAHYMLRWRLKDGTSPWSTTISATITG